MRAAMPPALFLAITALLFLTAPLALAGPAKAKAPTPAEAEAFMKEVESKALDLNIYQQQTDWVRNTYITDDTEALGARATEAVMEYIGRSAKEATRFDKLKLALSLRRKFDLLKVFQDLPAPSDPKKRAELAKIFTAMDSDFGKGKYCSKRQGDKCFALDEINELMAKSRSYDDLLDLWQGWHQVAVPLRAPYRRLVEIANEGAKELGFANLAELWNSRYDMKPADFEAETDRLWEQVKPLYQELHCYVRGKLAEKYGADKVPAGKPIPAHLLGNMWAQEWNNIYDLVAPGKGAAADLDAALKAKKTDERAMVKYGEAFFVSLGMDPLPQTFWERSLFTKPKDREVECHASAWDIDYDNDLRIKMCIKINEEDFDTIHHELGHDFYFRAYRKLDPSFRNSANDGFHEALGDLIALSVTPGYLKELGLIDKLPDNDLNVLMKRALEKVAFLPFGLLVDRWRWGVFEGKIKPENYNQAWWELRRKYQGVGAAVPRSESDFDPGAKYHVASNTPYTRYFLADILQFQFQRALCKLIGNQGPLHSCSIYKSKDAGARILQMMEMGQSRPWPEALKALTGEERMDASAILEYFAPLMAWLKEQNRGKTCGW